MLSWAGQLRVRLVIRNITYEKLRIPADVEVPAQFLAPKFYMLSYFSACLTRHLERIW